MYLKKISGAEYNLGAGMGLSRQYIWDMRVDLIGRLSPKIKLTFYTLCVLTRGPGALTLCLVTC